MRNYGLKKRPVRIREKRARILIVCEGEETEPTYFDDFHVTSAHVFTVGVGRGAFFVVQDAIRRKNIARLDRDPYDQIWAVFDKDDFPTRQLQAAIQNAQKNGISYAFSNEAFELWLLLHFGYLESGLSREQYNEKLSFHLGMKYHKSIRGLYDLLYNKQQDAIDNAKRLLLYHEQQGIRDPVFMNPSTTTFELVELLRQYAR